MSTQPTPHKLDFAPLHRTTELENIHAQVIQNDLQSPSPSPSPSQQQQQLPATRKVLMKHMTVIGDGSDIDINQINIRQ
jgi:hypothetical protein